MRHVENVRTKRTTRHAEILRLIVDGCNHLLWPAVCINCRTNICETDQELCRDCWDKLLACAAPDYCPRCGRDASRFAIINNACPDCQGRDLHFDGIARCGFYADSLRELILVFKLAGRTELAKPLSSFANAALQGTAFYRDIDFFVPVPLHWTRRLARGYNQSYILAKRLKHPTARISTDLVRIRRTAKQPEMDTPAQRRANVAGAFAARFQHPFEGKNICLVDDIKTTGATLDECAKTLKEAGAANVYALVLAVAGHGNT
jgi:competence protein ComFC